MGPGQVYVTRTGEAFHPAWCLAVGTAWDDKPEGLFVYCCINRRWPQALQSLRGTTSGLRLIEALSIRSN
jgi:hypothetical protein